MPAGTRHKTLVFLGFVLLALGLVGCGDGGPSQADIDATVEAKFEMAKASLVAPTAAPLPTHTPVATPTPTHTPAPTKVPINPLTLIEQALSNLTAVGSYQLEADQEIRLKAEGLDITVLIQVPC